MLKGLKQYSTHLTIVLWLVLLILLTGFSSPSKYEVFLYSKEGDPVYYRVEIADDEKEHAQGLMHREQLGDGQGMFFVFDPPEPQTFWMKNTHIPLDILFMDEQGAIVCMKKMAIPEDSSLIRCNQSVRAVLEVHAGQADLYGFRVGDKVHSSFFYP